MGFNYYTMNVWIYYTDRDKEHYTDIDSVAIRDEYLGDKYCYLDICKCDLLGSDHSSKSVVWIPLDVIKKIEFEYRNKEV
jgi:hypothetical protein